MARVAGLDLVKATVAGYGSDHIALLAAALAFYASFAIAPLLIIVIEIGGALLGGSAHHDQIKALILARFQPAIGKNGAEAIAATVQATLDQQSRGGYREILAWALLVIAATGFFGSIQASLDAIWHAGERPGFLAAVVLRAKSFAIIAGASVVLVLMVVISTWLDSVGAHAVGLAASAVFMVAVATALFALLYKWLPRTRSSWRDVFGGAFIAALLTVVGQYAIGLYLSRVSTTSVYGAAGSFVAILLWLYYSSTIFLIGAELIKAYARCKTTTSPN